MTQEQIKALIQMLGTLIITIAAIFGFNLTEDEAQQAAIIMAAVVIIGYSVWRNCNVTKAAGQSQQVLDGLKDGSIDTTALDAFLGAVNDGTYKDGKEDLEGEEETDDGQ